MIKQHHHKKKKRLLFTWWGSGWHVYPLASLIAYAEKHSLLIEKGDVFRWWEPHSLEEKTAKEKKHVEFLPVISGKWRRETPRKAKILNVRDIFLLTWWCVRAFFFLLQKDISIIFCKWGYAALPWVLAGALLWKDIIVHESDTKPWLVNRIAARFAKKNYVWFMWALPDAEHVWQILSDVLLKSLFDSTQKKRTTQQQKKTQILINWWSLWARMLYIWLDKIISTYDLQNMEFTVLLWNNTNFTQEEKNLTRYTNVTIKHLITQKEMWEILFETDIAVTRAGTTSLAEQALFDCKLIIIPLIVSHDQKNNALHYVKHNDALMINQHQALVLNENFVRNLWETLETYGTYKKNWTQHSLTDNYTDSKAIIREYILSI